MRLCLRGSKFNGEREITYLNKTLSNTIFFNSWEKFLVFYSKDSVRVEIFPKKYLFSISIDLLARSPGSSDAHSSGCAGPFVANFCSVHGYADRLLAGPGPHASLHRRAHRDDHGIFNRGLHGVFYSLISIH